MLALDNVTPAALVGTADSTVTDVSWAEAEEYMMEQGNPNVEASILFSALWERTVAFTLVLVYESQCSLSVYGANECPVNTTLSGSYCTTVVSFGQKTNFGEP